MVIFTLNTLITSHFFNLTDIAVIITAIGIGILAFLFVTTAKRLQAVEFYLLAAFLCLNALHSVNSLIFWNTYIHPSLLANSPDLFFILSGGFFLQGPALYLSIKKTVCRGVALDRVALLHLLPFALFPICLYFAFLKYDYAVRVEYLENWSTVFDNTLISLLIWAQRASIFIYSLLSYFVLRGYVKHTLCSHITIDPLIVKFYKTIVVGLSLLSGWVVLGLLQSLTQLVNLDSFMGVMENYIRLTVFAVLFAQVMRCSVSSLYIPVHLKMCSNRLVGDVHLKNRIVQVMDEQQPFRDPLLTQAKLATVLGVSPKRLTYTLKQQFDQSFWGFVSSYRVRLAAQLLTSASEQPTSILDVMKACGFNSKSSFNNVFKKEYGVSPSAFRRAKVT